MAITYTPNIRLALQENKQDYLNWDAIVSNWQKIDAEIGALKSGSSNPVGVTEAVQQAIPADGNVTGSANWEDI